MTKIKRFLRDRTNQKTAIAALAFFAVGLCAILIAKELPADGALRQVLYDVGSFFVATMVVGFVWELLVRRNLLEEMRFEIGISSLVQHTGLIGFGPHRDLITEKEVPHNAREVDLLLGLSDEREALWHKRDELRTVIRAINDTEGSRIRIVLPSPDSPTVRQVLARRLEISTGEVETALTKAIEGIRDRLTGTLKPDRWELRCVNEPTFFSYARFDRQATALLCKKAGGGQKTPRLQLHRQAYLPSDEEEQPRDLFEYFEREFSKLFESGSAPLC